jgi:hypothetical protein
MFRSMDHACFTYRPTVCERNVRSSQTTEAKETVRLHSFRLLQGKVNCLNVI